MRGFRVSEETTPQQASASQQASDPFRMPSSQPVLLRALRIGVLAAVLLAVVFGIVGYFVSATPGAVGGALGPIIAGALSCVTIGSIAFANHRFIESPNYVVIFFAMVAGGWLLKLVAFIVVVLLLRDQTWLDTRMLFFSLIAGIIASLAVDVLVATRSRLPYVSDPGA